MKVPWEVPFEIQPRVDVHRRQEAVLIELVTLIPHFIDLTNKEA